MRILYFLACFLLGFIHAGNAQDYIITLNNEVEQGKVTYAPSEGDKIFFKANGTKKAKTYSATQVRGYYQNGLYYVPKFWSRHDRHMFTPSFREGDDSVKFKKVTKQDVVVTGQINYYHTIEKVPNNQAFGPGYERADINVLDVKGNPLYIQVATASELASIVKDYKDLHDRVMVMKREVVEEEGLSVLKRIAASNAELYKRKDELTKKQVEEVLKEYNAWYVYRYASNED